MAVFIHPSEAPIPSPPGALFSVRHSEIPTTRLCQSCSTRITRKPTHEATPWYRQIARAWRSRIRSGSRSRGLTNHNSQVLMLLLIHSLNLIGRYMVDRIAIESIYSNICSASEVYYPATLYSDSEVQRQRGRRHQHQVRRVCDIGRIRYLGLDETIVGLDIKNTLIF